MVMDLRLKAALRDLQSQLEPRVSRSEAALQAPREDGSWFHAELDCSECIQQSSLKRQMKTKQTITKTTVRTFWNSLLVVLLGTLLAAQAEGQIFVSNLEGPGGYSFGPIGVYDA